MQFTFVDRILEIEPGVKVTTVKCLSMGEEYLADHFPRFPVMPGVLMLQAMTDAGALLVAASEDFAHSMITLKEARNVRFADFVQPGRVLKVSVEIQKLAERDVTLKARGDIDGRRAVNGRLVLERYNLADSRPMLAETDEYLKQRFRSQLTLLQQSHRELAAAEASPDQPTDGD